MRQKVLAFVLEAPAAPEIPLDRRAVEDVLRHMAAVIVAVHGKGEHERDDEPSREQQDQE